MTEDDQPLGDQLGGAESLDFMGLSDLDVFGRWTEVMRDLAARGFIWSGKSRLADRPELLAACHFGVEPLKVTHADHDLVTENGRRVQVKSHRLGPAGWVGSVPPGVWCTQGPLATVTSWL